LTLCRRAAGKTDSATIETLVQMTSWHYQAHCADHTRPYPKVLKMLDLLRARQTPMGLLSNKPHPSTLRLVKLLGIDGYFADVRGCADERDRKPSPKNALEIAATLDVEPSRVYLVGDSPMDVETARNAGMIAVAVTWGYRARPQLEASHPDFVVDDPGKIPDLVKKPSKRR
ncbi:MAG TPA: HAD family hydrolase, partial [Phycisphaerae bacterium]|nr:HAD family hydrolase [Phycisphaerae bacterium]